MATKHVAVTGNNANSGNDLANAWLTCNYAAAHISGGDIVYVHAGTYAESMIDNVPAGSSGAYTQFIAWPGDVVWLRPSSGFETQVLEFGVSQAYIKFSGIGLDASQLTDSNIVKINAGTPGHDAHHITLDSFEAIGFGVVSDPLGKAQGILTTNSDGTAIGGHVFSNFILHSMGFNDFSHAIYLQDPNTTIEGFDIYNYSGLGIHLYNGYGPTVTGTIVRNGKIHDARLTGAGQRHCGIIVADGHDGAKIYNVLIYNIPDEGGSQGVLFYTGSNTQFSHSSVRAVAGVGVYVGGVSGTIIRNVISVGNSTNYFDGGSGTTEDHNLFSAAPAVVNAGANDFRPVTGSTSIDTGVAVSGITTDILGIARPQGSGVDIGPYEFEGDAEVDDGVFTVGGNTSDDFIGVEDSFLIGVTGYEDDNAGLSEGLEVHKYGVGVHANAVLRFTGLSSFDPDATVTDAVLNLYQKASDGAGTHTITAKRVLRAWTQLGVTWNEYDGTNAWGTPGGTNATDIDATVIATISVGLTLGWYQFDSANLTALVQGWIDGSIVNNGIHLERTDGADDATFRGFSSSEDSDGLRPYLTVTIGAAAAVAVPVFLHHYRQRRV